MRRVGDGALEMSPDEVQRAAATSANAKPAAIAPVAAPKAAYRIPDIDTVSNMPVLGEGASGKVVWDEANNLAIKYNTTGDPLNERELRLNRAAGDLGVGPRVVAVSDDQKAVAIELLSNHRTFDGARREMASLPRESQIEIAKNVVRQMAKLHRNGIMHNDFHSGNVMYNPQDLSVRVIDYGLADDQAKMFQPLRDISRLDYWFSEVPGLDGPTVRRVLRDILNSKDPPNYQQILDAIEADR
jgi:predicted Ser/Thr protein kinase